MHRIRHLDDNGAHRLRKGRMPYDSDTQFVVEVAIVVLTKTHDVSRFPGSQYLFDEAGVPLLGLARGAIRPGKEGNTREGGRSRRKPQRPA